MQADIPPPGEARDILPGLRWLRFPLPFPPQHVNMWLLEEETGWTAIDCGVADAGATSRPRSTCARSNAATMAVAVLDNPALARRCAEHGIVFTVVPTNSYYLRTLPPERWALDHPIRRMPAAGLRIHPNTDDPPLHRVDPAGCWPVMARDFGFAVDHGRCFILHRILGAFLPEDEKRGLAATFTAECDRLRAESDSTP